MRRPLVPVAVLLTSVVTAALTVAATPWPTDHGNNQRSGYYPSGTKFGHLARAWGKGLDGAVYGSPIVLGGYLVVATENNTVYELNATTGAVRWSRHLATPAPTSSLACSGNISPSGITGTPAFDAATNRIFVVTNSVNAQFGAHHEIFGLNATTGATVMNRRVAVPGQAENAEQERGALAVSGGNVYIPFGGLNGDCGQYKGAVVSLKTNGALGGTAWVTPTAREGGIWAPGGAVVARDGSVYVAIGNGASTSGAYDGSDSVTRISPTSTRLDYFAPSTWPSDNASDLDLGSMTPALTANGYILQAGKSGTAYVLKADRLGGVGGQVSTGNLCRAFGVSAVTGSTVYLPCTNGITRVEVTASGQFRKVWTFAGATSSPVAGNGALYAVAGSNLLAISGAGKQLGSIALGSTPSRFSTPALEGSKVFVGTNSGIVAMSVG
ncbi:MAG: PQQ-like protein [Frankiales bacterium]|jgi:outer membrane protein assembly factor BamB|nr:PQQ-like protein [Frankiales bacterium]